MGLSRSPHGERGLKSVTGNDNGSWTWSLSSWRAWIEISPDAPKRHT